MKRFLLSLCCVFLFVGCSSKSLDDLVVLECDSTNSVGNDGNTLSETSYKIYFDNDKVERISMNIHVTLNSPDDTTRDNLENDIDSAFGNYKNRDGVIFSSNIEDNGFIVNLDIDYDKLSDEDKEYINVINYEKSFDDIKVELENNGFSCK